MTLLLKHRSVLAATIVLALLVVAQTGPGRRALRSVGATNAPKQYTALSFVSPTSLPEQAPVRRTMQLRIAIKNHEGAARRYVWTAWQGVGSTTNAPATAATGAVVIASQATREVEVRIRSACTLGPRVQRMLIEIRLTNPDEAVRHWMTCPATAARS
jgi:hypothetical protein